MTNNVDYEEQAQGLHNILTDDQRVRVFVSSTLRELADERKAVREAISDLRLHPVLFEPGARPYPPRDVYHALLEQSHVFVGIYWKEYGWVAPDMTLSGVEDEYNLSENKLKLIYMKQPSSGADPRLEELINRIRAESGVTYSRFSTPEELKELIKNDLARLLSERFGLDLQSKPATAPLPSYLAILQEHMAKINVLARKDLVQQIQNQLVVQDRLLITGEPGVGKTYLLGMLGAQLDAIYISLRNRSTQQPLSYLANHLMVKRGQVPRNLPSKDEAREALQLELAKGTSVILIDDIDQNLITTHALLGLDTYKCRFIFAARNVPQGDFEGVERLPIPGLKRPEVEQFLQTNNLELPPGETERLLTASTGNPLYLYYFTQQQLSPLPQGLEEYQRVLWARLSPQQQELLNLIAFARISPLALIDLHELLNSRGSVMAFPMDTKRVLEFAAPLVRTMDGHYELFHPYFEEHIRKIAEADGLAKHYHELLSNHSIEKGRVVAAAYHLLRAEDSRASEYLLLAAHATMLRGDWALAEEFLVREVTIADQAADVHREAYARLLLSQLCHEVGKHKDARRELNKSIELFRTAGEEDWLKLAENWSDVLLIDSGGTEEALERVSERAEATKGTGGIEEAAAYTELSYACIRASRYRRGADAATHALEVFTQLGDERGMYTALVNLSNCVGSLGDYELQGEYATKLIEKAREYDTPFMEAVGLNHLAIVQRRKDDPEGARQSLERAIALSQQLGMVEREVTNIANLGNVFLDQKLYTKAESAYTESLIKAREHGLPRSEGFALELLARLRFTQERYTEAINLGTEALQLHEGLNDPLRIASTQDYLARSYAKTGQVADAAKGHDVSGREYERVEKWSDAAYQYGQAVSLYYSIGDRKRSTYCLSRSIQCALLASEPERAGYLLENTPSEVLLSAQSGQSYLDTLRMLLAQNEVPFLVSFLQNFATYSKTYAADSEKVLYLEGLNALASSLMVKTDRHAINGLAVALIHSDEGLLPQVELDALAKSVTSALKQINYRVMPNGTRVWTFSLDWAEPLILQIVAVSEDTATQRAAMALVLVLAGNSKHLEQTVTELGGNQETSFSIQIVSQRDWEEALGEQLSSSPLEKGLSATISVSAIPWGEPQPPTVLVLHDGFDVAADYVANPNNKAGVWVLMSVHGALLTHLTHGTYTEADARVAKRSSKFCDYVLTE